MTWRGLFWGIVTSSCEEAWRLWAGEPLAWVVPIAPQIHVE